MRVSRYKPACGFTLIELLVVMAIVGTLATYVSIRYASTPERAKETALRETLLIMREAIDRHTADKGEPPLSLEALQQAGYLRTVPVDPMTGTTDTWTLDSVPSGKIAGIADVHSGAGGVARDGSAFSKW